MAEVYNMHIAGAIPRIDDYITECVKAQSSGVSHIGENDRARFDSYLVDIDTYRSVNANKKPMDLPETHPKPYTVSDAENPTRVENEFINDFVRFFVLMKGALVSSQSARLGSGLLAFDNTRWVELITNAKTYLTDYVDKVSPVDFPESSPSVISSGPGATGINP